MIVINKIDVEELFRIFRNRLKDLGYKVEYKKSDGQDVAKLVRISDDKVYGDIYTDPFEVDFELYT